MSSQALVSELINSVKAVHITPSSLPRGVQMANYFPNDCSWDPSCPPGHSNYTWTGMTNNTTTANISNGIYIPLQIQAYNNQLKMEAAAATTVADVKVEKKKPVVAAVKTDLPTSGPASFYRLDIRVGKIVEVSRHPEADKLYIEKIDLGEEKPRTIVSGLVAHVPIDQMLNAYVFVICNLKASKLKGVESQGMVLCACNADKSKVELVVPAAGSKIGERVTIQGHPVVGNVDAEINLKKEGNAWEFSHSLLKTNDDAVATFDGSIWTTSAGIAKAATIKNGPIS